MKPIDRRALVSRHCPVITGVEPYAPLSIGNGEFAFTADFTGLQSFPEVYELPLGTQSQWGWHSSGGPDRFTLKDLRPKPFEHHGRAVPYYVDAAGQEEAYHWLRSNPHRLQLAQIGLKLFCEKGRLLRAEHISGISQTLDLWRGVLISRFEAAGAPVTVETCCHPERDQLAVRVESPLIASGRLEVGIAFPSPHPRSTDWVQDTVLRWEEGGHETEVRRPAVSEGGYEAEVSQGAVSEAACKAKAGQTAVCEAGRTEKAGKTAVSEALFMRSMDQDGYAMAGRWSEGKLMQDGKHRYRIVPEAERGQFECVFLFQPSASEGMLDDVQSFHEVLSASEDSWAQFWLAGGAVDLSGSTDVRAEELERRIVLSQYVTAVHCAGSLPPQETGLMYNSWYGKFHLEMHWWHAAHFALWGRAHLLRKSMDYYRMILPAAKQLARSQGYEGARWPKMTSPDGRDSPSTIGPLLLWQQPHPIMLAELCYLADPEGPVLKQFSEAVFESAAFMASFAEWDKEGQCYALGPPAIPAQERHEPAQTTNPAFELEYWRQGLETAQVWRERLGLEREVGWQHVIDHLAPLPEAGGVYIAHERCPRTFEEVNTDHPSMLGALGLLPGRKADPETMRRTLYKAVKAWDWDTAWGWDFPMAAMTAARLGERELAVELLMMDTVKNTYMVNGHNYQRPGLLAYLPGNGALLTAVALMAGGWKDTEAGAQAAPGFPNDGRWQVRCENINAWL